MSLEADYQQADARVRQRFAGVRTFARLRHVLSASDLEGVDVAVLGFPFNTATSYRTGARFGPRPSDPPPCSSGGAGREALIVEYELLLQPFGIRTSNHSHGSSTRPGHDADRLR